MQAQGASDRQNEPTLPSLEPGERKEVDGGAAEAAGIVPLSIGVETIDIDLDRRGTDKMGGQPASRPGPVNLGDAKFRAMRPIAGMQLRLHCNGR